MYFIQMFRTFLIMIISLEIEQCAFVSCTEFNEGVVSFFQQFRNCHIDIAIRSKDVLDKRSESSDIQKIFVTLTTEHIPFFLKYVSKRSYSDELEYQVDENAEIPLRKICTLHLYTNHKLLDTDDYDSIFHRSYNGEFAVVLLKHGKFRGKLLSSILLDLHYQVYTSLCYAVIDFSYFYSLCLECRPNRQIVLRFQTYTPSEEMRLLYSEVNMNRAYIKTDLFPEDLQQHIRTCDSSPKYSAINRPPIVEHCVIHALSDKLNYSFEDEPFRWRRRYANRYDRLQLMKWRQPLSEQYQIIIALSKREVIRVNAVFYRWGFMVMKARLNSHHTALVTPFNKTVWALLLLTFLLLCFVFTIAVLLMRTINKIENISHGSVFLAPFQIFGVLVGQGAMSSSVFGGPSIQIGEKYDCRNSLLFWLPMVIVYEAYKGNVYSFLTKSVVPSYPTTLNGLAEAKYNIATYSVVEHDAFGNDRPSVLEWIYSMKKMMMNRTYSNDSYYDKLQRSIRYAPVWLEGMRKICAWLYIRHNPKLLPPPRNVTDPWGWNPKTFDDDDDRFWFPGDFAVIDYLHHVEMQKHSFHIFLPNIWTSPVIPIDMVVQHNPWVMPRTLLTSVFKRYYDYLGEAGFMYKWDKLHTDFNGLNNFYSTTNHLWEKGIKVREMPLAVPMWNWYQYYFVGGNKFVSLVTGKQRHTVSLAVLRDFMVLITIMKMVAFVTFFIEVISQQIVGHCCEGV